MIQQKRLKEKSLNLHRKVVREKAIKKLFKSNPGREWTISEVLEGIYGNVSQKQASKVRVKITRSLSHGHLIGLWRRVSNKVGIYRSN